MAKKLPWGLPPATQETSHLFQHSSIKPLFLPPSPPNTHLWRLQIRAQFSSCSRVAVPLEVLNWTWRLEGTGFKRTKRAKQGIWWVKGQNKYVYVCVCACVLGCGVGVIDRWLARLFPLELDSLFFSYLSRLYFHLFIIEINTNMKWVKKRSCKYLWIRIKKINSFMPLQPLERLSVEK